MKTTWIHWVFAGSIFMGCAEVRFPESADGAGGIGELPGAGGAGGEALAGACATEQERCTPEISSDGLPLNGDCCNGRHVCFPVGAGQEGVCAYTAPEGACAPSGAHCIPELNADGIPTRGNCCLSRQTCFPVGDGAGVCEY